ncbi:MAG: Crp/Fnr family transcriptional regulator [Rhodospirillaceae bacterium]|jgi:CRP/FNR family transcriptional regulator|nr:Crp/Fnr family transcriptional regulator [Rhodospirillaceae bacterium]MBT4116843.1 Crp/Fnr family transcriptional regulator [Rhodospirillaceae bacterium]MBT4671999.1 Crp/Fnr family transcriptional regulator [Rhodospirillaceae bacterium]MBT4718717.1 Crp/Fnr family transcriptional regulator [Rhodospirillaceae bacterium]MBT4749709.1 Crp/Fnr family transcriptional regulator [Rhodospirillaceae bacterium]
MASSSFSKKVPNCSACNGHDRAEWSALNEEELVRLDRARIAKDYMPGDVVFHEGDDCRGIYCLQEGLIGVRKTNASGNSILLHLENPGNTMGYRAFLAGEQYHASAEALEPCRICFINGATAQSLLEHSPALGLRFLERVSRNLGAAEEKILQNATLSVRARFAYLLTVLVDRYAPNKEQSPIEFELPLSRHDLASMIGTTPESMSRTIAKMEQDGIAKFSGRKVVVHELDNLVGEYEPANFL